MPAAPSSIRTSDPLWWQRPGLQAVDGRLQIAGRDAERLARQHGTPLYAYDLPLVRDMLLGLQRALADAGLRGRVRVALKALRSAEFLAVVRSIGTPGQDDAVGIDACSPAEVRHALDHGFLPSEISFTGTNLSEHDFAEVLAHPVRMNPDLLTQIDRLGRLSPGRTIGLRLNPQAGVVNARTSEAVTVYSGDRPTKFGVYLEDLPEAVARARRYGLTIATAHFHVANGVLNEDLPAYDMAIARAATLVERLIELGCPITEINVGGGLGLPCHPGEQALDLAVWASILRERLGMFDAVVSCEPGEYISLQSGTLLAEVVTVERRLGRLFAGLDVGWNVMNHHFAYGLDMELIPCVGCHAVPVEPVTFTGNINEGPDLFVEDLPFPAVSEGDIVAMLNVGAYSLTMYHPHCLRPPAEALFLTE